MMDPDPNIKCRGVGKQCYIVHGRLAAVRVSFNSRRIHVHTNTASWANICFNCSLYICKVRSSFGDLTQGGNIFCPHVNKNLILTYNVHCYCSAIKSPFYLYYPTCKKEGKRTNHHYWKGKKIYHDNRVIKFYIL